MTPPRAAASSSTHWPLTPPATAIAPGRQCTPLFLPTQGTTSSPSPLPTPTRRFWSLPVPIDVEHGYFDVLAATCNNPLPLAPPVSTTLGESPIPLRPTLLFHAPPVGRQEGREEQHTMPEMRVSCGRLSHIALQDTDPSGRPGQQQQTRRYRDHSGGAPIGRTRARRSATAACQASPYAFNY